MTSLTNHIYRMAINGEKILSKQTLPVINPATEEVFAEAPSARKEDLDYAVSAARGALKSWRAKSIEERSGYIKKLANAIQENKEDLARVLTMEQGKPLSFARIEIDLAVHWCMETAKFELQPEIIEETSEYVIERSYSPVGVVAAIVPWNFPVLLSMVKIPAALLAGNTLIVKPSPFTPLTSLIIGELAQDIFPPGVYNVLSGDDDLGPWIQNILALIK